MLALEVLREVRGVEREHEAAATARVVDVDPEDALALGPRVVEAELDLPALRVHRHPAGDVLEATRVVGVQVAHRDGRDVVAVDPGARHRVRQGLALGLPSGVTAGRRLTTSREESVARGDAGSIRGGTGAVQYHSA